MCNGIAAGAGGREGLRRLGDLGGAAGQWAAAALVNISNMLGGSKPKAEERDVGATADASAQEAALARREAELGEKEAALAKAEGREGISFLMALNTSCLST